MNKPDAVDIKSLTPRRAKRLLREKRLKLNGSFVIPESVSDFQKKRLAYAARVALEYLRSKDGVEALAAPRRVTHQAISGMIKIGFRLLVSSGAIVKGGRK